MPSRAILTWIHALYLEIAGRPEFGVSSIPAMNGRLVRLGIDYNQHRPHRAA